ncbi:MAG: hypothetical protein ACRDID_07055 [Ktedonobacterales bacterium]
MRVRWRGAWLFAPLVGLLCLTALTACASGTSGKAVPGSTATTGPITVTTNLTGYTVNDAIGVTVSNTSSADYFAVDGKSSCVIVQLERYNSAKGVWAPMDLCALVITVQTFAIAKDSQQQFTLTPSSSSDPNSWDAGLYRVSVVYSAKNDGVTGAQQAHCAAFTIK